MPPKIPAAVPEEKLFLGLHSACNTLQKNAERALRRSELSIAEYTMLRIIENSPGITAGEARKRLYSTAPSVAQLIAQLERRQMIRRVRDTGDARRLPLHLSPRGRKHLQEAKQAVSQLIRSLRLPSSLIDSLLTDLSTLLSSLPHYGAQ